MCRVRPALLLCWLGLLLVPLTALKAKDRWAKVESPYFTLYAECGVSDAREWATCFEQFRRYVTEIVGIAPTQLQPLTIVLFKDREALKRYLPRQNGKTPTEMASLTANLPTGTIVITSLNWDDDETRQSFYEAGTYWFLSGFKYGGPDWFRAGLAGTFKTFTVSNDEVQIGAAPNGHIYFLREHHLMPLAQLFGTTMSQLDYRGDDRTSLFHAQSWLLVHYLIYGRETRKGAPKGPQLADFVGALQYGVPADSAFQHVFETDYDGMGRRLENYLAGGRYAVFTGKFDRAAIASRLTATVETEAGVELARGYASLAGNWRDEARAHFLTAQAQPEGAMRASEALGDMAMFENNTNEAGVQYGRALELGSRNSRASFFFGEEIMRGQMNRPNELPRFEPKRARTAASRFEQAINQSPEYVPSYERLALLMPSLTLFSEADRQFLELGMRVAPDNALIEAGLGVWELKNRQVEKGQQRLRALLAPDRQTKGWARLIAEGQAAEQATDAGMTSVRQLIAEGKFDEAGEQVEKLLKQATTQAQRAALVGLRGEIGLAELVNQAEKLVEDKQWDAAGSIAQTALDGHPAASLRQRAEAVVARAAARK